MNTTFIKTIITVVFLTCSICVNANDVLPFSHSFFPISLNVRGIDPTQPVGNPHKSPVYIPQIGIEEHTIYFIDPCDGCTLRVVNEDGEVEYATVIPVDCDSLELPSTLEGEYEIQILRGNYYFYGMIEL